MILLLREMDEVVGAALPVVQRQLHHSDAKTTLQVYARPAGHAQREAVGRLTARIAGHLDSSA